VRDSGPARESGQVLPLFALFLIVLLGLSALAVDVSGALAARRAYRSIADAASLAGAQDLQIPGSRAISPAERIRARQHAMQSVTSQLGITASLPTECDTSLDVDVTDACILPGTDFHVSIKAGTDSGPTAILCQTCDPARSVQVGLRNANYQLAFARVLGQQSWNVGIVSVAGIAYGRSYAIQTLRPPKTAGSTFDVNDIEVKGNNTVVNVQAGDVGTNSNMVYSGTGAVVNIDSGYGMYYFDPYFLPKWYPSPPMPPNQIVKQLPIMMEDPNYRYPAMSGVGGTASTYDDARASEWAILPNVERADADASCLTEANKIPMQYGFMVGQPLDQVYCYSPGIYESGSGVKNARLVVSTGDIAILRPGVYYFKSGADVGGRLVGGYEPNSEGVALMFDETGPGNCPGCVFKGNNAVSIVLNAGTKFPVGSSGSPRAATPAVDWDNLLVQTSGPSSPTTPLALTVLVRRDTDGSGGSSACVVPMTPPLIEPADCRDGRNQTISISGGGQLYLDGVQYAPTDNVFLSGSSDGKGTVGQIIAWTLTYTGGTTINQEGAGSERPGTLRLDEACTAPGTPCNP